MIRIKNHFIYLLLFPFWSLGQNLLPPIQNYGIFDYNAASKNWGLSTDQNGELFGANNRGLLHYDGETWELYRLPNNTTIRSVASIEDKIYTGSYEEFGYWTKNEVGRLTYTSLTHLIKNYAFTNEEFWQIIPFQDAIYFRSFSAIYKYTNGTITVIDPLFVVTSLTIYENRVLVAGGHEKLYSLVGNELTPIGDYEQLKGKIVTDMDVVEEGLLIGTKLNGCYVLKNNTVDVFNAAINSELKQYQLNQILPLSNGQIAFGTIKNGVYLYDDKNGSHTRLNREAGLQNNTVLSMLQFKEQLWLGLDNGIDRVQLDNPLAYYTDLSGSVGTVYDLAEHKDILYLGSNTGIYYFLNDKLQFIEGSQGHVWDLEVIEDELFCGHNTGTFKIESGQLQKVSDISGGYQIVKIPSAGSAFLQGTYTGIAKYEKDKEGQWSASPLKGIDSPVKYLCFEDANTMWVAHPYKGFNRIKLNGTQDEVLEIQEFKSDVVPTNYNIKLYNIRNQIVLFSGGIWYKYDPILDKITTFEEFQQYNGKDLIYYDEIFFWFIDNNGSREVIQTDLKANHFVLDDAQLRKRLAPEAENIIKQSDSIFYFTLTDGFGKLNLSKFKNHLATFELPTPNLRSFEDQEEKHALIDEKPFEIRYKNGRQISMLVSASSMVQPRYYYELMGEIDQSSYKDDGMISFQNLPFGKYQVEVSTVSIDNKRSKPLQLAFEITPPWYLSKLSLVCYLFSLLGMVFLIRWLNKRKLERKHNRLKEKLQREQEEHLVQLEKEKLNKEIKSKQNELTSTTMKVAKKNELILELKALLIMNKDKFDNKQRYRSFVKKLESSINDNEDWKHFEVNFKELHEEFFKRLKEKFPKLTHKDLKLCAYIKMNFSTKEIAPLMNISLRGVETHRYRLKKKLQIEDDTSISTYLINFS